MLYADFNGLALRDFPNTTKIINLLCVSMYFETHTIFRVRFRYSDIVKVKKGKKIEREKKKSNIFVKNINIVIILKAKVYRGFILGEAL